MIAEDFELMDDILQYVYDHQPARKNQIQAHIRGSWTRINNAIGRLEQMGALIRTADSTATRPLYKTSPRLTMLMEINSKPTAAWAPPPPPSHRPVASHTFRLGNVSLTGDFALCIEDGHLTLGIHTESGSYYFLGDLK